MNMVSGIRTFFKSPILDVSKKYGIVGVPYDSGCTFKRGTAFAPSLIRDASAMLCDGVDLNGSDVLGNVSDFGDVEFSYDPSDYSKNPLSNIPVEHLITVGGDHSIACMTIQRMYEMYGKIQLIHFDAHCDAWDGEPNHGTFIRQVIDYGWIDNITQIGIRSPCPEDVRNYVKNNENITSFHAFADLEEIYDHILKLKNIPTYITFDIDVLEPSYIGNGTGTPEPFGLTPKEVLMILSKIISTKDEHIKGFDIVEVSDDTSKLSAQMAANIIWKYIAIHMWSTIK